MNKINWYLLTIAVLAVLPLILLRGVNFWVCFIIGLVLGVIFHVFSLLDATDKLKRVAFYSEFILISLLSIVIMGGKFGITSYSISGYTIGFIALPIIHGLWWLRQRKYSFPSPTHFYRM